MRTRTSMQRRAGRIAWPVLAATGLMAMSFAGWGCGDSQSVSSTLTSSASTVSAGDSQTDAGNGPAIPTLDELRTLLNLTDEQAQLMQAALDEWTAELAAHRGRGHRGGPGGPPPDSTGGPPPDTTGCPPGGMGPGGEPPSGGPGGGPMGDRAMGPPVLGFLAKVSSFLDTGQFTTLAGWFVDQRAQNEPAEPPSPPAGETDRMAARLAQKLGIDHGSAVDLVSALDDARSALRDLGKQYADGTVTLDGVRSGAGDLRVQLAGRAEEILGSETYPRLVELLADRRTRMAEGVLSHLSKEPARRAESLAALLNLDDAGKQAVASALEGFTVQRQSLWEGIRDGQTVFEEALYQNLQIDAAARSAVRAVLTGDQATTLDAVEPLLPHARLMPLYL
jgi:hypothetical protein